MLNWMMIVLKVCLEIKQRIRQISLMNRVLILLLFISLYSCNQEETKPAVSGDLLDSHNEMVALLASTHAQLDPMQIQYYANSKRAAIGLRLKLIGERKDGSTRELYRTVSTGGSFGSSTLRVEIGLGDIHRIKEITLNWPNSKGTSQSFKDIRVNSFIKITEEKEELVYLDRQEFNFRS